MEFALEIEKEEPKIVEEKVKEESREQ